MITDSYGGHHSSSHTAAVEMHERAVCALASHRPVLDLLDAAIDLDPDLVAARALRSLCHAIAGSGAGMAEARRTSQAVQSAIRSRRHITTHETALVDSAALAAAGLLKQAAARLEAHLAGAPTDFLAIKLAHILRFMTGGTEFMLATTSTVLPEWRDGATGHGFVLGCHAFALEECGQFSAAEQIGRMAVAREPLDVWGLHAVAHVMEMRGRTGEGAAWLEPSRPHWPAIAGFGLHLAWHLALFRLSAGDCKGALQLYDQMIEPAGPCDYRDMLNAASLLWRLMQEGVVLGNRWDRLSRIAEQRSRDVTNVLGSLHDLLVLVAAGRVTAASELLERMAMVGRTGGCDQADVAARVGVAMGEAIHSAFEHGEVAADLVGLASRLPELGGSRAQRDVLLRELLMIAARLPNRAVVCALTWHRLQQRSFDRFQAVLERRLARADERRVPGRAQAGWSRPLAVVPIMGRLS